MQRDSERRLQDFKEALQEALGGSIDQDAWIIYAEYDELDDDLAAYKETLAEDTEYL